MAWVWMAAFWGAWLDILGWNVDMGGSGVGRGVRGDSRQMEGEW